MMTYLGPFATDVHVRLILLRLLSVIIEVDVVELQVALLFAIILL